MLFRLSYVREMNCEYARLQSNQRPLPSRGSALSTELRAWGRSLRQDSNPHLGRTTGACLPLTLRRLEMESHVPIATPGRCVAVRRIRTHS